MPIGKCAHRRVPSHKQLTFAAERFERSDDLCCDRHNVERPLVEPHLARLHAADIKDLCDHFDERGDASSCGEQHLGLVVRRGAADLVEQFESHLERHQR